VRPDTSHTVRLTELERRMHAAEKILADHEGVITDCQERVDELNDMWRPLSNTWEKMFEKNTIRLDALDDKSGVSMSDLYEALNPILARLVDLEKHERGEQKIVNNISVEPDINWRNGKEPE
jgi:hypothetical protein